MRDPFGLCAPRQLLVGGLAPVDHAPEHESENTRDRGGQHNRDEDLDQRHPAEVPAARPQSGHGSMKAIHQHSTPNAAPLQRLSRFTYTTVSVTVTRSTFVTLTVMRWAP